MRYWSLLLPLSIHLSFFLCNFLFLQRTNYLEQRYYFISHNPTTKRFERISSVSKIKNNICWKVQSIRSLFHQRKKIHSHLFRLCKFNTQPIICPYQSSRVIWVRLLSKECLIIKIYPKLPPPPSPTPPPCHWREANSAWYKTYFCWCGESVVKKGDLLRITTVVLTTGGSELSTSVAMPQNLGLLLERAESFEEEGGDEDEDWKTRSCWQLS